MKTKMKIISTLASVAVLAVASNSAMAAGTAAATPINNTASISYSVSGTAQTDIYSSPAGNSTPGVPGTAGAPTVAATQTQFLVDKKIDLLVTSGTNVNVVPGSSAQAITFTVTNEGNSTENFDMSLSQVTGDDFDTSSCAITAPATLPVSLAADAVSAVTVECDIPPSSGTVTNGASSDVDLLATVSGVTETAGADTAGTVDTVFADDVGTATDGTAVTGLRNASHSAVSTYDINTADLVVAKTSAVTADPSNGTTNPKRIPGATIEYTITVSNADGAAAARSLAISDVLPTDLTFVSCSVSGPAVLNTVYPAAVSGTPVTPTCANSGGTVTTSSFTLPGGSGSANVETLTIVATVN